MSNLGVGCYQGASPSVAQVAADVWLCHLCPSVAVAIRQAHPNALIILRPDDANDGAQVDLAKDPVEEAGRWYDIIQTKCNLTPRGTYSATLGINEAWPGDLAGLRWRAAFELALCNLVHEFQDLKYIWGGIPAGNLNADEVAIFADVWRAAWAVNAHLYLPPGATSLAQDTDEWYVWRPLRVWLPELEKLGIPLRLLAGEVGTWTAPNTYANFSASDELTVGQNIVSAYAAQRDLTFLGGCCFGVGTVGATAAWDLSSVISQLGVISVDNTQPQPNSTDLQAKVADLESRMANSEKRDGMFHDALIALLKGDYTGAASIAGEVVAMDGKSLDFTPKVPLFPKA